MGRASPLSQTRTSRRNLRTESRAKTWLPCKSLQFRIPLQRWAATSAARRIGPWVDGSMGRCNGVSWVISNFRGGYPQTFLEIISVPTPPFQFWKVFNLSYFSFFSDIFGHNAAHSSMHAYIHTYMHPCMHTYMHTYTHACMHAYIHAYINHY